MFGPVEQGDWLHACGIRERYFLYDFCEEILIFNPPFRCAQLTAVTEGKVKGTQEHFDQDQD